jgi:hypothetical protein
MKVKYFLKFRLKFTLKLQLELELSDFPHLAERSWTLVRNQ